MILSFNLYWTILVDLSRASQRSPNLLTPANKKNDYKISEKDLGLPFKKNKDATCESTTKKVDTRSYFCKFMNEKRLEILRCLKDKDYTKVEIRRFLLEFYHKIRNQMPEADNLIPNSLDLVYRKMFIGNFKFSYIQNLFLNEIVFQTPENDNYISYNIVFDLFKIRLEQFLNLEYNKNIFHLQNKIQNIFEYVYFLLDLLIVEEKCKSPGSSSKTGTKTFFSFNSDLQPTFEETLKNITSHMDSILNNYQIEYYFETPKLQSYLVEIFALFNIIKSRTLDTFRIFEILKEDSRNKKILNLNLDIFTNILVYLDLCSDLGKKSKKKLFKNNSCIF